jgi:hypothetical protein
MIFRTDFYCSLPTSSNRYILVIAFYNGQLNSLEDISGGQDRFRYSLCLSVFLIRDIRTQVLLPSSVPASGDL